MLYILKGFYEEMKQLAVLTGSDCFTRVVELHRLRMLHIRNKFYSENGAVESQRLRGSESFTTGVELHRDHQLGW